MPIYRYECEVAGAYDGEVEAKNKKEAEEKIKQELSYEGLCPVGDIDIERLPKQSKRT
jgi:hypothetical protein